MTKLTTKTRAAEVVRNAFAKRRIHLPNLGYDEFMVLWLQRIRSVLAHVYNPKSFIIALQVIAVFIGGSSIAYARTDESLQLMNVRAELQKNGTLHITEELTFSSPTTLHWPIYGAASDLAVTANGQAILKADVVEQKGNDQLTVSVSSTSSQFWVLSYRASSQLIRSKERDQLYLQLQRESGFIVNHLQATFRLPSQAVGEGLIGNVYAIGGVGQSHVEKINDQTLFFQTDFVGPKAIVTVNAHWPKSVLRLSLFEELRLAIENLEVVPWIGLGIFLPLLSFAVLARLLVRQRRQELSVNTQLANPPGLLSPLIVGTLVDKKVYPKEIVAMLIDLCQRGYLVIVKKSGQYYLSQRKPFDAQLEPWERDILEALFPVANTKLTRQEMQALNHQSLFDPKVRRAFDSIYDVVTTKQFFAENPHQTRVRYKLFALALYFFSLVGAIWIAVSGASPFLLLPIAGTMLVCQLIIKLTPRLVHYTPMGFEARSAWLSFGNYLAKQEPLPLEASRTQVFEKHLGYAVALGKTIAWAERFDLSEIVIIKPDWFISYEETTTAQFAEEIESFSRSISRMLTEMRGPLVN